jgi:hypothetical protein
MLAIRVNVQHLYFQSSSPKFPTENIDLFYADAGIFRFVEECIVVKSYIKQHGSNFYRYCLTVCDIHKCFVLCELVRIIVSFCSSGDCLKREGEPLKFGQDFNLCSVESLSGHVSMCH